MGISSSLYGQVSTLRKENLSDDVIKLMALGGVEKGLLNLLRVIKAGDIKQGATSDAISNAALGAAAVLSECDNADFMLAEEMRKPVVLVHRMLAPKSASVAELGESLEYLEKYGATEEAQRADGALVEFLVTHPVGQLLCSNAASAHEAREHETKLAIEVTKVQQLSADMLKHEFIDVDSAVCFLDQWLQFEEAAAKALKEKVESKGMSSQQKSAIQQEINKVFDHVQELTKGFVSCCMVSCTPIILNAVAQRGMADHPTAEEGKTVKGPINCADFEKHSCPPDSSTMQRGRRCSSGSSRRS